MKRFFGLVLLAALLVLQAPAKAQPREYSQAELDALLAPIALYPDPLLSQVLVASTYPEDLGEAAAWSRANPHLKGDDAVRAAEPMAWDPSLKALLAFPDLLARMDESPQWTADLGIAFRTQEPQVMDTVQGLRRRAQASGALQSNEHQQVVQQGQVVVVQPAQPQIVYVRYYDPYVVYGPWWWPAYRPVFWRPWYPRPAVYVSAHYFSRSVDWRHRHVVRPQLVHHHQRPGIVHHQVNRTHHARPVVQGARVHQQSQPVHIHNHAQQVRPIVQGAQINRQEPRSEQRREHRQPEQRREHRQEGRNHHRNGRG